MKALSINSVIITGATGAIGTALINELLSHNIKILVITRKDSKRNSNIPNNELISIKYYSISELCKIENLHNETYDVFYHLAWQGTSGNDRNDMYMQNDNVKYSLDAVKLAKKFNCKRFVGIGSQAEFGRTNIPLKSDTPCNPENGYGIAKYCAGKMTRELATQLGLEHIWVRVLSVYGINDGKQSLITYLIDSMIRNETPTVTKCEQIWDYLYSKDAGRALYLVGKKGISRKVYVLGSGEKRILQEYVEEINDAFGGNHRINYGARDYSDKQVMYLVADITEIKEDTGWSPEYSFKSGIIEMLKSIEVKNK